MGEKFVLRTISNLSFAGEYCDNNIGTDEAGILLKPSDKAGLKIWCPLEEIQCILTKNGKLLDKEAIAKEYDIDLQKSDKVG